MIAGRTSSGIEFEIPLNQELISKLTEHELIEVYAVCRHHSKVFTDQVTEIRDHFGGEEQIMAIASTYEIENLLSLLLLGSSLAR